MDEKKGDEEDIVEKVTKFFFADRSFADTLERWVEKKAEAIDVDDLDEFQLKYTELHNEFKTLYERMLEDYIESQGSTIKEFYFQLQRAQVEDTLLADIILATADFDVFMTMMRDYRKQNDGQRYYASHHK